MSLPSLSLLLALLSVATAEHGPPPFIAADIFVYDAERTGCQGEASNIGHCIAMGAWFEMYLCTAEKTVHMAYCEDSGCLKCGAPILNMYHYVDGECNRDFLKAVCSPSKPVAAATTFTPGWAPPGLDASSAVPAVAHGTQSGPAVLSWSGEDEDVLPMLSPDEAVNGNGAVAWDKKPSPMMPWLDIDKFEPEGAVITEADQYVGGSGGNQAADTASSFTTLSNWDNLRACAELTRARKIIGRWSKGRMGAGTADSADAKQALRRCAELEDEIKTKRNENEDQGGRRQRRDEL